MPTGISCNGMQLPTFISFLDPFSTLSPTLIFCEEKKQKKGYQIMARAVWKGPFVEESLMKKVDKYKTDPKKIPIKTWSRKSTILPDFVGVSFLIYNGKKFIPITVSEDMVGHKLGEFAPTRSFFGHTPADKKAKPAEAEAKK